MYVKMFCIFLLLVMSVGVYCVGRTENWYNPMQYCQVMYVRNISSTCCTGNVGMCLLFTNT